MSAMHTVAMRIPDDLKRDLEQAAKADARSFGNLVRLILEAWRAARNEPAA